ncbi:hypothetical protein GCM10007853_08480 [Algimonas ampicilliniresistens]|uniref:Uncharacterized protein n=1 Tax=Algimonas ampicilliniresistens TaxID=1298735 RepID=A0ABQ5V7M1_9PROT|nr:hypothetical protein GCM10007853_08480 [Algimonas ampicilliniresistens]
MNAACKALAVGPFASPGLDFVVFGLMRTMGGFSVLRDVIDRLISSGNKKGPQTSKVATLYSDLMRL